MAYGPSPRGGLFDPRRIPLRSMASGAGPLVLQSGLGAALSPYLDEEPMQQVSARLAPVDAAPPPRRGLLDRLLGLPAGLRDGTRQQAHQQGLLSIGAALLNASGPNPSGVRTGLGPALAQALAAGQQGAAGGAQSAEQSVAAEQERAQRGLLQQYMGDPSPEGMRNLLMVMLGSGNIEGAKAVSEAIRATRPEGADYHYVNDDGTVRVFDRGRLVNTDTLPVAAEGSGLPARLQPVAMQFLNRFETATAPYRTSADQYRQVRANIERLRLNPREVGPSSIGALYSFVKQLDPGSVVREGEVDLLNRARGILTRVDDAYQNAMRGGRSADFLDAMSSASRDMMRIYREAYAREQRRVRVQWSGVSGLEGSRLPLGESPFDGLTDQTPEIRRPVLSAPAPGQPLFRPPARRR